jgi:hypothetical protein
LGHGDTQGACPVKADSVIVNPVKPRTIQLNNNNNNNSIEIPDSTQKPTPANTPRRPR